MDFSEYEKIPTGFRNSTLSDGDIALLDKITWCATEKIHGANFRFVYQDRKLLFGKRKALLHWIDDFFGFQKVAAELENRVLGLFEKLVRDHHAGGAIIYGELFGGTYPHPEVEAIRHICPIQTGIYYAPDIQFCAYDIALLNGQSGEKTYLSYELALRYFRQFDIFHAKPIQVGKLVDLLNMDLRLETRIPGELRLPRIPDNIVEGIVIKPYPELPSSLKFRPIVKIKNPEFEENISYHEAQKWSYIPDVKLKSQDLDFLLQDLYRYVTPNRMNSAISKIGPLTVDHKLDIETEFLKDIIADFDLDNDAILSELNPEQKSWISERIRAAIQDLMNKL